MMEKSQASIDRALKSSKTSPEAKASLEKRSLKKWKHRERRRSETHPKADIEVSKAFHRDTTILPHKETEDQEKARIEGYKSDVRSKHQIKRTAEHEARRGIKTKGS